MGSVPHLRFTLDDRTIDYSIGESGVERVVLENDRPIARETFVMPRMRAVGFDDDAASGEVTLLVARAETPPGLDAPPVRPFPITARLNRGAGSGGEP